MTFTCTQENLLNGLARVTPIAGRNSQLPVLRHVLIRVEQSVLHLTTTDLEVGVHTSVGGKKEKDGSCTVPAKSFYEYIQQLPKTNPITLKKDDTKLVVLTEGFHAEFPIADAEEFPLLPESDSRQDVELPGARLVEMLSRVMFAASREETRPEIRSVFIKSENKKLYIAATDSFRLVEGVVSLKNGQDFSLLLPLSTTQEVVRLFGASETVVITFHENYVSFRSEGLELTSRLVEGNFPDYQQIIPLSSKTVVSVDNKEFSRALKTLAVFLPRDSRRVQLEVYPTKGKLAARVVGGEMGQGDVELALDGEGGDVKVMVNIQYLLEGISRIPQDVCEISFVGAQDPIVFRPKGEQGYLYIVMPIQSS